MKKSIATGAKRGSIGTLILEALSTSDKYGWEIIKEIESKSNGEYILKEPSLYSSLKRMEVSGLITSYWQDSDIGGRRHYYNISQKGLDKLAKSNIEWSESKQFVNELFNDEEKTAKTSSVESSIRDLNRTVNEVQKTVNNLHKNEYEINEFIKHTDELEKNSQPSKHLVVTQPQKTANGLILPSINPLQQDLFSLAVEPEQKQTIQNEEVKTEENISENLKANEEIIKETDELEFNKPVVFTEQQVKPATKGQKYTSTPTSFVQMPIFEAEQGVSLSGIVAQEESIKSASIKEEDAKPIESDNKPTIRHIKSLATEKDFLDHKYSFLNKKRSFVNKVEDYTPSFNYKTDTELEKSDLLYGAFELKEEIGEEQNNTSTFNNLGLEETIKAKQALLEQDEEQEETTPSPTVFKDRTEQQEQIDEDIDDIDYKSILGELFSEDEENKQDTGEFTSTKDLPRINVTDNVNVSLRAKKQAQKEQTEEPAYSPTYTYKFTNDEPEEAKDVVKPSYEEEYIRLNKPVKELKNFNSNINNDEYSNAILEDAYLSDIKVRTHKQEPKTALMTTSYVSVNKLNLGLSFVIFILMLIQIGATYIGLTNAGHINADNSIIFVIALALNYVPVLIAVIIYLINPDKKKEINYNLLNRLGNNFIVLLIALVFIYATNLFLGMNNLNTMDFIATWLLPAVLCANLLLSPIIKFVLLKRRKYYI